ncbi:MAG: GNAT family N-acetyltransferase [Chloroflexi bacterium]|nr:MAG: GNAT family N-acetyltransferase [Chloroflexota bacterium]
MTIDILNHLPDKYRQAAAETYYEAFRRKLHPIMRDDRKAIAALAADFDAERAIVALVDGEFAGIAGIKHDGRQLANLTWATMRQQFGIWGALWRFALLALLERKQEKGVLLMDGIAVRPEMRGKGVGTQLLEAVYAYAREAGFDAVRLDVVDTNPRARQLYERRGFIAEKTASYPFLQRVMGFSAVTTMTRPVNAQ